MIYSIYSYKNKTINAFTQPVYCEIPVEYMIENVKRHVFKGSKNLMDHELWLVGEFNDNTGILKSEMTKLIDIDEVLKEYETRNKS